MYMFNMGSGFSTLMKVFFKADVNVQYCMQLMSHSSLMHCSVTLLLHWTGGAISGPVKFETKSAKTSMKTGTAAVMTSLAPSAQSVPTVY